MAEGRVILPVRKETFTDIARAESALVHHTCPRVQLETCKKNRREGQDIMGMLVSMIRTT